MKTPTTFKIFLLVLFFTAVANSDGFAQKGDAPTITKTFQTSGRGSLIVESSGGGVMVEAHDRNVVEVRAFVRYKGRTLAPDDPKLDELKVIIEKRGSGIVAKVDRKMGSRPWNQLGVSFTVFTSREMSCALTSNGGGVNVSGVSGTHQFESNGGGISLENITGSTEAQSAGGGVHVQNQNGNVRLVSNGGGVSLADARGDIYARSSGGGVRLENVDGQINARSSGGAVRIMGVAPSVVAQSSGGAISMDISGLDKELKLETSGGGIHATIRDGRRLGLDLDLKSQNVNINLDNFSGIAKKDRIDGTSNGGGIPVYMRTAGGSINVDFL